MRGYLAAVSLTAMLVALGAVGQADMKWGPPLWSDDFEGGGPTWVPLGSPGASQTVVDWKGDKAFRLTVPYLGPPAGFSLAYVENVQTDQGMLAWVDTSPLASDDVATVCVLRYSTGVAFGTGYAVVIIHGTGGSVAALLFQINETGYTEITDTVGLAAIYTDVWVRFAAFGTDANTRLIARVWPAGQAEPGPGTWTLDSDSPGGGDGITSYYNSGRGGVGTVALAPGITADAYFDDIEYHVGGPLCVECPW